MENKLKVLAVDDENVVLNSIEKHLLKENYAVILAGSAQRGLEILDEEKIDIVLTDLMMPEIDGLEFMKLAKEKYPTIPVIMITGYATINTALKATQLGAFDYLAKPFTKSELKSVVNRAAQLVSASANNLKEAANNNFDAVPDKSKAIPQSIGEHVWSIMEDDGLILLGVKQSFLNTIGKIQNVFLPSVGDELRQGSVYLRIFSSDMQSHIVQSPLSGTVVDVNQKVIDDPNLALEDPYGRGWLIRLKPSKFEFEIKELGL
ncbi:MAG: response regulator [Candidatus Zixiibacteriota bacterium]